MEKQLLIVVTADTKLSDEEVMDLINFRLHIVGQIDVKTSDAKFLSAIDVTQPETFQR